MDFRSKIKEIITCISEWRFLWGNFQHGNDGNVHKDYS